MGTVQPPASHSTWLLLLLCCCCCRSLLTALPCHRSPPTPRLPASCCGAAQTTSCLRCCWAARSAWRWETEWSARWRASCRSAGGEPVGGRPPGAVYTGPQPWACACWLQAAGRPTAVAAAAARRLAGGGCAGGAHHQAGVPAADGARWAQGRDNSASKLACAGSARRRGCPAVVPWAASHAGRWPPSCQLTPLRRPPWPLPPGALLLQWGTRLWGKWSTSWAGPSPLTAPAALPTARPRSRRPRRSSRSTPRRPRRAPRGWQSRALRPSAPTSCCRCSTASLTWSPGNRFASRC